jgi:hypothetical protein
MFHGHGVRKVMFDRVMTMMVGTADAPIVVVAPDLELLPPADFDHSGNPTFRLDRTTA